MTSEMGITGFGLRLKLCPFCGGEAIVFQAGCQDPQWWSVRCGDCDAEIGADYEIKQHAENEWNKRTNRDV